MGLLADEAWGPLAGEVVCAIAGLPTDEDGLWQDRPDDDDADDALPKLEDDDLDADLVAPKENELPVPNPEAIAGWWQHRRSGLDAAVRHLGGRVLGNDELVTALWEAPMRRRHALAMELAVRSGGGVFVNTRGLCRVQRDQLGGVAESEPFDWQRGLPLS